MSEEEIMQEAIDLLLDMPLAALVDAQYGAERLKSIGAGAWGEWSTMDDEISDLVETIITFRIDEGITL